MPRCAKAARSRRAPESLAGAEGFEPPSSVLETDSLTVELTPLCLPRRLTAQALELLCFPMRTVCAAALAELRELEAARGRLFVLRRRVVALLALGALQCHNLSHLFILTDPRQNHAATVFLNFSLWHSARALIRIRSRRCRLLIRCSYPYARISEIAPAPTVRPPSRIANRNPFSIATGVCNSISNWMLSPGITISVPSGSFAVPVTSVVRK